MNSKDFIDALTCDRIEAIGTLTHHYFKVDGRLSGQVNGNNILQATKAFFLGDVFIPEGQRFYLKLNWPPDYRTVTDASSRGESAITYTPVFVYE